MPLGFYAEHWRSPEDDPDYPVLVEKYGESAWSEVAWLRTHLVQEVVTAAGGLLYTVSKIEGILAELQAYVEKEVPRWAPDEPWPEFGYGISHPLVVEASFEFMSLMSWLRGVDERLDRRHLRSRAKVGLLPALADRPLKSRVKTLMGTSARRHWSASWPTTCSTPAHRLRVLS